MQVLGNAKPPNDELVNFQTAYSSTPNRKATNSHSADGQCTDSQRAECLSTDRKSPSGARVSGTEDAQ